MVSKILTLEDILVVKSSIVTCLSPELKREILCVPGSEYDLYKSRYLYYRKEEWSAVVERRAKEILHQKLSEMLQDKVMKILPAIALRMLIWAEYHEGILGLTRYFSLNFINHSHFTTQGVIDNKKAAEDLLKDINLNIKQKYKLACVYCLTPYISSFFMQIVGDKNMVFGLEDSKWMETPEIVKFWTFQMTGRVDESNKYTPRYLCGLQKAIESGSKEAVRYSWETQTRRLGFSFTHAISVDAKSEIRDWIVFRDRRFDDMEESWIPTDRSVDIIQFFLSNMTEKQQQDALEKNIKGDILYSYENDHKTVLELFLRWPYQDYFMNIAAVLWDSMPLKTYAVLLLKICDNINPCARKNLLYGEERSYDYRKLLKDFWNQSPDRFKRYIFTNKSVASEIRSDVHACFLSSHSSIMFVTPTFVHVLLKLLFLKKFTYEDEEIIRLILDSATIKEKANITSVEWWGISCINILTKEKFEIFDRLLLVLCISEEKISEFKKKLNLYKVAKAVVCHFLWYCKMNAVKSFIKWISFSESKLLYLKKNIFLQEGNYHCGKLLLSRRYEDFEQFIKWFLPCREEAINYKRKLTLDLNENVHIQIPYRHNFVTHFVNSYFEVKNEIKTGIQDTFGLAICEDLIVGPPFTLIYEEKDSSIRVNTDFRGGQWKKLDEFLTWCLSTKKKILEFKNKLLHFRGPTIHINLIKANQWKEAKRFFDWLGLSETEIKTLKKCDSILYSEKEIEDMRNKCSFNYSSLKNMLSCLVFEQDDEMRNLEKIDLLLRWHLTDKESVIEFRDDFFDSHEDCDAASLKKFNSLIESYLEDIEQEEIYQTCGNADERFFRYLDSGCLKRKYPSFHPQKKLCLSQTVDEKK